MKYKSTYVKHEVHMTPAELIAQLVGCELTVAAEKLEKEQKRLLAGFDIQPFADYETQVILNCFPRKFKMHKTPAKTLISVNALVNLYPESHLIVLTRGTHQRERFIYAENGKFYDDIDSSRFFVDKFWVIGGKRFAPIPKKIHEENALRI